MVRGDRTPYGFFARVSLEVVPIKSGMTGVCAGFDLALGVGMG